MCKNGYGWDTYFGDPPFPLFSISTWRRLHWKTTLSCSPNEHCTSLPISPLRSRDSFLHKQGCWLLTGQSWLTLQGWPTIEGSVLAQVTPLGRGSLCPMTSQYSSQCRGTKAWASRLSTTLQAALLQSSLGDLQGLLLQLHCTSTSLPAQSLLPSIPHRGWFLRNIPIKLLQVNLYLRVYFHETRPKRGNFSDCE